MGICFNKQKEECEMCKVMYEDLDKFTELPTISPILRRQNGYIHDRDMAKPSRPKRTKQMTLNQIYKNEMKKSLIFRC